VWILLQPRGYLGGFVLYGVLAIGVYGVFFGGYDVKLPATTDAPLAGFGTSAVFPFLFVTIACGACSGFHGLVCSGTTSKQIDREGDCKPVGYGAMLLEGLVAVVALSTVMILSQDEVKAGGGAAKLYGSGVASFLCKIIGPEQRTFAEVFGQMAFSTFVFDTLDVATRLGRYIVQELTGKRHRVAAFAATFVTVTAPAALLLATGPGGFKTFWTLFGTSNQLLAALTLLGIAVWLRKTGRRCWYVVLPMAFVMTITVWSLWLQVLDFAQKARAGGENAGANYANAVVGLVLLALAVYFVFEAVRTFRRPLAPAGAAA
jgi:carbon starvation protein